VRLERGDFDFLADLAADQAVEPPRSQSGELPFVILPPGERIQSFIGDLRSSGYYRGGEVDLGRLNVLEALWDLLKDCSCTLYRGIFPSSGKANGYVVLAISYPETEGEDAVAISPWKGEHATFVVRYGCGAQMPWQTVLSRTKNEAKALGARRLVFTPNEDRGMDEYQAMREKILALLACEPDEFDSGTLYFDDFDDCYRVRAGDDSGAHSTRSSGTGPQQENSPSLIQRVLSWFSS
jgi:hypothetical protein